MKHIKKTISQSALLAKLINPSPHRSTPRILVNKSVAYPLWPSLLSAYSREQRQRIKVAVAMSGGVDSSITALLVAKAGFNTIGVFMRNWDDVNNGTGKICRAENEYAAVLRVANLIGIPCVRVDYEKQYWTNVFERMIEGMSVGKTPNPDVGCNREIKFKALFKDVIEGAGHYFKNIDYVATGPLRRVFNRRM